MKLTADVIVLGPGCTKCKALAKNVKKAMENLNSDSSFEYITDMKVMISLGIMSAPALILKNKIVSVSKVPTVSEIEKLLKENSCG